ncbi:hypothetical protein OTU49_006803 [Cherax quadricarinatus]|uniref:Uncharacterized protein n=1 Tax=Cherax quadricarinatus TaxID=27406 RepID=A0AAW0WYM3_CHEQU
MELFPSTEMIDVIDAVTRTLTKAPDSFRFGLTLWQNGSFHMLLDGSLLTKEEIVTEIHNFFLNFDITSDKKGFIDRIFYRTKPMTWIPVAKTIEFMTVENLTGKIIVISRFIPTGI